MKQDKGQRGLNGLSGAKIEGNVVGKLAIFGDRIMRAKAKQEEQEFTPNLQGKLESIV